MLPTRVCHADKVSGAVIRIDREAQRALGKCCSFFQTTATATVDQLYRPSVGRACVYDTDTVRPLTFGTGDSSPHALSVSENRPSSGPTTSTTVTSSSPDATAGIEPFRHESPRQPKWMSSSGSSCSRPLDLAAACPMSRTYSSPPLLSSREEDQIDIIAEEKEDCLGIATYQ